MGRGPKEIMMTWIRPFHRWTSIVFTEALAILALVVSFIIRFVAA